MTSIPKWARIYQAEIADALSSTIHIRELLHIIYAYFDKFIDPLGPFQQRALETCLQGFNTFITGPAGAGKTFLLQTIVDHLKVAGRHVIITASTGLAAVLIKGQTIHSYAKLLNMARDGFPDLSSDKQRAYWLDIWRDVDVLIIDEISMITPQDFQNLVRLWTELGLTLQIILLGDFFQLPPVIKDETIKGEATRPYKYCFQTPEWNQLVQRHVYLHDVFRQTDLSFVRVLNRLRMGQFTAFDLEHIQRRWVGHSVYRNDRPAHSFKDEYTWIFGTNMEANEHNRDQLTQIKSPRHDYTAQFGYAKATATPGPRSIEASFYRYRQEDIPKNKQFYFTQESYRRSFGMEDVLSLKLGARVLLTVNLNTMHGLVNGACGIVVAFKDFIDMPCPIVQFDNIGPVHIVPHEWQLIVERDHQSKIQAYLWMVQLPLRYAYAVTAHKSQGQTFSKIAVSLRKAFVRHLMYTAISRVETINNLHLMEPINASMFQADPVVSRFYASIM